MASFFRKSIAQKVLSMLQRTQSQTLIDPVSLSASVKVDRNKTKNPQLILPLKGLLKNQTTENFNPFQLVKLLRNQGLPTAEGFIDISLCESSCSLIFSVDKHVFSKLVLMDICGNKESMAGSSCIFENIPKKSVIVDCSSPSVGEVFNMKYFRYAIHSKFIANINRFVGHDVTVTTHVNDWGSRAAQLLSGYKQFGSQDNLINNPATHLAEVMSAADHQYKNDMHFKKNAIECLEKMEEEDDETVREWRKLKNQFLKHNDCIYKRLGIEFDDTHFDSSCFKEIKKISDKLLSKKLISTTEDGKIIVEFPGEYKDEKIIFSDDLNTVLYNISRCIFAATYRKEKHSADTICFVASETQKAFLSMLIFLIKELGFQWSTKSSRHAVVKDMHHFDSKKYRKTEVTEILDQAKLRFLEKLEVNLQLEVNEGLEKMAEILGLSSLSMYDMKCSRKDDYHFAWENIVSFGQNTPASFQFCHAGLKGVEEDSEYIFKTDVDTSPLMEDAAHYLIQHLSRFDEMIYLAYLTLDGCVIYHYLSCLWYFIDEATNVLKLDIKDDKLRVIKARLFLLSASLKVFQQGLLLLGVTPLENFYFSNKKESNV